MNAHSQKRNRIAKRSHASRSNLSTPFERLPEMVKMRWRMLKARWAVLKVRRMLGALRRDGVRLLKLHPVPAVVGAFTAGMAVMKLARHV